MSKISEAFAGHRANFNCELNLQGRWPMSARLGLYRRMTTGFLPDVEQNSALDHRAMDFSVLGRWFNVAFTGTIKKLQIPLGGNVLLY